MNYNRLIPYWYLSFFLLLVSFSTKAFSENTVQLTITDPFIEMHTGPGESYPIFHVLDRGQSIVILKRKTSWYKIRSVTAAPAEKNDQQKNEKIGWVAKQQMQHTLLPSGQHLQLAEQGQDDFIKRQWELGVTTGKFANAPIISIYGGYLFNENLSTEMTLGQSVATVSSSNVAKVNLLMQPFPEWRYSPFFTIGAGAIRVKPNATLINPADRNNAMSQIGIGVKTYLSQRFILRFEYNQYVIFSASNDRDENEDISEWKFGFAIFF